MCACLCNASPCMLAQSGLQYVKVKELLMSLSVPFHHMGSDCLHFVLEILKSSVYFIAIIYRVGNINKSVK